MGSPRRQKKRKQSGRRKQQPQGQQAPPPAPQPQVSTPIVVEQSKGEIRNDVPADQKADNANGIYRLERWQHRFTAALVLFTAVQAIFAVHQWNAMVKQNDIMRNQMVQTDKTLEQMRLEQRAWLGVVSVQCDEPAIGTELVANVKMKNTGLTPGIIVNYGGLFYAVPPQEGIIDQTGPYGHVDFPDNMKTAVPPQGETNLIVPLMEKITDTQFKEIMGGKKTLYLIGNVTYVDAMKQRRRTWWCFVFDKDKKAWMQDRYNNSMD